MSRGRILIVEDEYIVAADVEAALAERGYETVGIAPDMQAALELAAASPDLALVDIHLRDGPTGLEIAERLSGDFRVPVLFVTANANLAGARPRPGILGVLDKPCAEDAIGAALDYVLTAERRDEAPPAGLRLFDDGEPSASPV